MEKSERVTRNPCGPSAVLPKHGNRSVVIGLGLLRALASCGGPATLGEVARAAGLPASRTHRFLAGMVYAGAVRQDSASGRYDLGPLLIELGVAALGRLDGTQLASEALKEVTARTGLVSLLTIWGSRGPTVIRLEHGGLATSLRVREGESLPLIATATGKTFLAYLPEALAEDQLRRELDAVAKGQMNAEVRTMEDVKKLREQVRAQGLGASVAERSPGIAALSVPVFGADGSLAMVIAVLGVVGVADLGLDGPTAEVLREVAGTLSHQLGFQG